MLCYHLRAAIPTALVGLGVPLPDIRKLIPDYEGTGVIYRHTARKLEPYGRGKVNSPMEGMLELLTLMVTSSTLVLCQISEMLKEA